MTDELISTRRVDTSRKFLLGKDDWIFLDRDSNRVIDQISGRYALDERGIETWCRLIHEREEYAASVGAQHIMLVAPNKELVYAEKLPDGVEVSEHRAVRQIISALRRGQGPEICYPLEAIKRVKPLGFAYPKTDTHWSGLGAYIGYLATCDQLSEAGVHLRMIDPSRVTFEPVSYVGDLGAKLDPPASAPTLAARIKDASGHLVFDNRVPNRGRMRIFNNTNAMLPRCVMFGDSFGGNLLPFLKESFSILVYIYGNVFDREIIEAYKPDVVLTQVVERFLVEPPVDSRYFTYMSVVRSKLNLLSARDLAKLRIDVARADPAIVPMRSVYEAMLQVHAGCELDPALVSVLRRHSDNPEANYMASVALSRMSERLEEASDCAARAVAAQPQNPRFRHQLALTFIRRNDLALAEAQLRHAIELDPSIDWWKYQLAQVLFRQRRHDLCCDVLMECVERDPHSCTIWQLLGRCHEARGHIEEAAGAFQCAAEAKPDWAWPLLKLANLRIKTGTRPDQGLAATSRLLEIALEPRQRAEAYLLRARLWEMEKRLELAVDAASRSVELCPDWDWAKTVRDRLVAIEGHSGRQSVAAAPESAAS
ncbi:MULTISPECIES: alginate O-acetyltransferase AlgX-related protein [Microvirga]|uniref:alginate O-acetyltransferase AlgX-related protein n=1 Tax=Microvirga TaxID=186650 RepID=UPI001B35DD5D|nr:MULTISPECIES: tetratricopeptide repeat protein [unclassified Microvirga]MBQ0820657.1 tetratricopeptide repeat protein [Microvirga sp. HBU67558]